jgi:hypothetical protein
VLLCSAAVQLGGSALILRPKTIKPSRIKPACYLLLGFVGVWCQRRTSLLHDLQSSAGVQKKATAAFGSGAFILAGTARADPLHCILVIQVSSISIAKQISGRRVFYGKRLIQNLCGWAVGSLRRLQWP